MPHNIVVGNHTRGNKTLCISIYFQPLLSNAKGMSTTLPLIQQLGLHLSAPSINDNGIAVSSRKYKETFRLVYKPTSWCIKFSCLMKSSLISEWNLHKLPRSKTDHLFLLLTSPIVSAWSSLFSDHHYKVFSVNCFQISFQIL